jgi:ABC-type dipeptide/oligopeptide/nickel transport system permease subunit
MTDAAVVGVRAPQGPRRLGRPRLWAALTLLVIVSLMTVWPELLVAPSPATHDPLDCSIRAPDGSYQDRLPPSAEHWFGTDVQGCDYYARVMHGARTSVVVGVGGAFLATTIGLIIGATGAFRGGWADGVFSRVGDVFFALPYLVGAILILSLLTDEGRTEAQIVLAIGILSWPLAARIVRSTVLQAKGMAYVEAARSIGVSGSRVLWRHIGPNAAAPIVVYTMISVGVNIGVEATLTYLGVGMQSPAISWGLMIDSASEFMYDAPHLLIFPSVFVTATVFAFLLLADVIRDISDPRLR